MEIVPPERLATGAGSRTRSWRVIFDATVVVHHLLLHTCPRFITLVDGLP